MANPLEVVGLTSRHAGRAGANVAAVDDAAAVYYNPAGLVARPGAELSIGGVGARANLDGSGSLPDPFGVQLAVRVPLPLRGPAKDRVVIGMALHLLPSDIAHVVAPAPDQPYYAYYGDRMSRLVVMPGAAVRFGRLAVGASIDMLAGVDGQIVATEGATRAIDSRIDVQIPTVARVGAGATWQLTRCVRIAIAYRQRFEIPVETSVRTLVAGEPIDLDLAVSGQFTPHVVTVGGAWERGRHVVSLDARYARWSDYAGPYVRVESRLPLVGDVPALSPRVPFEDTFGARAGLESKLGRWTARGGYGFETSPSPAVQAGVTNLLDGPRHTFAAGGGRTFGRLRVDAHVQLELVGGRELVKEVDNDNPDPFKTLRDEDPMLDGVQITNPGFPSIRGGGHVLSAGLTVEVGL